MLNPTDKVPIILIVDGLFLLCLGLFIIILHMYEQAEDEKEKESVSAFKYFWEMDWLMLNFYTKHCRFKYLKIVCI